jgi:hypothetical protein
VEESSVLPGQLVHRLNDCSAHEWRKSDGAKFFTEVIEVEDTLIHDAGCTTQIDNLVGGLSRLHDAHCFSPHVLDIVRTDVPRERDDRETFDVQQQELNGHGS